MKALRVIFLSLFMLWQLIFPVRAYAFAPLIALGGAAGSGFTAASALEAFSIGAAALTVGAGIAIRLDGNTQTPVPGWPTKPGSDGAPVPTPPVSTAKLPDSSVLGTWYRYGWSQIAEFVESGAPQSSVISAISRVCTAAGLYQFGSQMYCSNSQNTKTYNLNQETGTKVVDGGCLSGYSLVSGACSLTAPADVKKPSGIECEIVFKGGQFSADSSNPSCDGVTEFKRGDCTFSISGSALSGSCQGGSERLTISGNSLSYTTPAGTATGSIEPQGDGQPPIITVPAGTLGAPASTGTGSGSGTGTGSGTGSGTGTGTGTGTETPPLDLSSITSAISSAINAVKAAISNAVSSVVNAIQASASAISTAIASAVSPLFGAASSIKDFLFSTDMPDVEKKGIKTEDVKLTLDAKNKYFTSNSCPEPKKLPINIMGTDTELVFTYKPFCDLSIMINPFFVLLGYFMAARIIFRGAQ